MLCKMTLFFSLPRLCICMSWYEACWCCVKCRHYSLIQPFTAVSLVSEFGVRPVGAVKGDLIRLQPSTSVCLVSELV